MKSARLPASALANTRSPSVVSVTLAPKKSDARPIAMRTRPAIEAAISSPVIAARTRPFTVLAASGRSSVNGAPRVGAVAVDILKADRPHTVAFRRAEHGSL